MRTDVSTRGCSWSSTSVGSFGSVESVRPGARPWRQPRHQGHERHRTEQSLHRIKTSAQPTRVSEKLVTATLQRPLGLNLKEDGQRIVVESIEKNSNADRSGLFSQGDTLVACSAIMMVTAENANDDDTPLYDRNSRGKKGGCCSTGCPDCPFNHRNWQRVMFDCRGKSFETVIAALQSNSQARWLARGAETDITVQVEKQ